MVYCVAFDCNNDSRFTTGISYHCFPSDPSIREQWLAKISHVDLVISKYSRLCLEHFTPNCYKRDLKAELLGSKPKAILKSDAMPSLFSHRPPPKKPRLSSERRSLEKTRQEVRPLCYVIHTEGLIYDGAVSILCNQDSIHSLWGCMTPKYTTRRGVVSLGPIIGKKNNTRFNYLRCIKKGELVCILPLKSKFNCFRKWNQLKFNFKQKLNKDLFFQIQSPNLWLYCISIPLHLLFLKISNTWII